MLTFQSGVYALESVYKSAENFSISFCTETYTSLKCITTFSSDLLLFHDHSTLRWIFFPLRRQEKHTLRSNFN